MEVPPEQVCACAACEGFNGNWSTETANRRMFVKNRSRARNPRDKSRQVRGRLYGKTKAKRQKTDRGVRGRNDSASPRFTPRWRSLAWALRSKAGGGPTRSKRRQTS